MTSEQTLVDHNALFKFTIFQKLSLQFKVLIKMFLLLAVSANFLEQNYLIFDFILLNNSPIVEPENLISGKVRWRSKALSSKERELCF